METIEDIVADIRMQNQGLPEDSYALSPLVCDLLRLADRIEAAVKREREATCKDSLQVGNAAKMREALEAVYECAKDGVLTIRESAFEKVVAALAAPPRNCDKCLTPEDAMLAHLEEVYEGEKVEFGDYEWCEFVKWLFAEAKGETK